MLDGPRPGAHVTVSERQAQQLVAKGLAKMQAPHSNKMKVAQENKAKALPWLQKLFVIWL